MCVVRLPAAACLQKLAQGIAGSSVAAVEKEGVLVPRENSRRDRVENHSIRTRTTASTGMMYFEVLL